MGLKCFIWRSIPAGRIIDTVKNIADEGGIADELKCTYKEDVYEDASLTTTLYNSGIDMFLIIGNIL